MSKRSLGGSMSTAAKRARILPPPPGLRHSIKRLPLELREEIYRCVLDDLTNEPAQPYSDWPSITRFQTYVSLLLTDRGTSAEVKRVWNREGYCNKVVLYADDTCTIYDFEQEFADHAFFSHIRFKLRSRCDYDFDVGDDLLRDENEQFIGNQTGYRFDWDEEPGFYRTEPYVWPDDHMTPQEKWIPEQHGFESRSSGHSECTPVDCVSHTVLLFPALRRSLRLRAYVWKLRDDDCTTPCSRKVKSAGIMELSGMLQDVSFRRYHIARARHRLIHFLVEKATPSFRQSYSHKYPVTELELIKMKNGRLRYWFQDQDEDDHRNMLLPQVVRISDLPDDGSSVKSTSDEQSDSDPGSEESGSEEYHSED